MTRKNSAVSVTTTATQIAAASVSREKILIANNGASTVFLGDANVTTANGFPLAAAAALADSGVGSLATKDAWYGVVASGTCDVRVIES